MMRKITVAAGLLLLLAGNGAWAQSSNMYWLDSSNGNVWRPVSTANPMPSTATLSGSVTATTAATAAATPAAVGAGTNKPLYISLNSELFTTLSFGGTPLSLGSAASASSIPVVIASDQAAITVKQGTGTNLHVVTDTNSTTAVTQTTAANLNATVVSAPATSGGLSLKSLQVANNTTSVAVDTSPGQLYQIEAFNNSTTIAYIKLYNTAQGSTTCGSGTVIYRGMIPGATGGAGYVSMNLYGLPFSTAITACITTGYSDVDTTAPAGSTYLVNFFYK